MKTLIPIFLLTLYFVCVDAKAQVRYSYDDAGNRIRKEMIVLTRSASTDETEAKEYNDNISGKDVKIYPNKSNGKLTVEIFNWEETDRCNILLLTGAGRIVRRLQAAAASVDVDIRDLDSDIHILNISLNGRTSSWKLKIE